MNAHSQPAGNIDYEELLAALSTDHTMLEFFGNLFNMDFSTYALAAPRSANQKVANGAGEGRGEGGRLKKGDRIKVIKDGSRKGEEGVIVDPDWKGQLKVALDGVEGVKSYLPSELTNLTRG
jgi:hypothetical protein